MQHRPYTRRQFVGGLGSIVVAGHSTRATASTVDDASVLAESKRPLLLELLSSLIQVQSLSGEPAVEAQSIVRQFLASLPYRVEQSEDRPSRYVEHAEYMPPNPVGDGPFVNLVAWPDSGEARHAMFAHIDTHVIEGGWLTDPFEPVARDGRLYGLGTSDDKGGVAAMLVAAAILAEAGESLPVVMSLHGKGGGSRGSLPVFDRLSQQPHGLEGVLYVHPAETGRGLEDIKTAVLGILDIELSVTGWRGEPMEIGSIDSAEWSEGGNAIRACWNALAHLGSTAFVATQWNIGMLQGGDRVGSVAENASARLRLKFDGSLTWRELLERARDQLDRFENAQPEGHKKFRFSIRPVGYRTNPGAADWNSPVSRVLRESIESVTGRAPDAYPNHYAGDIRYPIRLLGVPAYGIGSLGGNFYGPNEWVDVDDLVNLVAVLVRTMTGWSALSPGES